ncbi:MAG TPA: undecaprenyldiphospho-muramoylpentapeptide beta-N-acetylglucosaminyltransferase [Propionibacteriaceae bacterium]
MTTSGSGSVVLAGGGTAGHTSPLIATGLELRRLGDGVTVTALGTARGLETSVVPAAGLQLELIPPVPMPRRVGKDFALLGPRLLQAVRATAQLLRRVEADVVLGFGGYVSTPAYLAARRLGLPVVIHEQNVLPGLANKLAARLTREVYTSFPQTSLPHARCIGLPMRRGITDLDRAALRREARMSFELDPELPTLLVSGGSQGALRINTAVAGAWPELLGSGIQVLHVLGPKNLVPGIERSVDQGSGAVYQPVAYVAQMERAYAAADLMLARSGANTVLETAAVGLPAVFVPYPHGNGEQALNAELVINVGGGMMLADRDCTSTWVAQEIPVLFAHPDRLTGMSQALASVARLDAATVLASRVLEVMR